MAFSPDDFQPKPPPAGSPLARDRGLRRGRRLTRWIAVAAVAGAAALGGVYTHLLPGGQASPAPAVPSAPNPTTSSSAAPAGQRAEHGEGGDDDGAAPATPSTPQPPAQPPAPSHQQPQTTTGAS
ncbi:MULTISPECIES: hypothetical protein [unclassified Streptomyces]|uniref:hypothetical protein n=1 Tax=unclassified Streptomyces TaxID=2593676 RepID=UPI00343405DF